MEKETEKKEIQNVDKSQKKPKQKKMRRLMLLKRKKISNKMIFDKDWMNLDNAALIYPSAANSKWRSMYRLSVYLKDPVMPRLLQKALEDIMPRFPSFDVGLRRGFFWYYFEQTTDFPKVEEEKFFPCRPIEFGYNKHLFRVLYFKTKISLECFHSLADGFGAVGFFNALLARYFVLCKKPVSLNELMVNYLDKPNYKECEDSFASFADLKKSNKRSEKKAYQIHGTKEDFGMLNIVSGSFELDKVSNLAKSKDLTINEFLLAVYYKALLVYQSQLSFQPKPIKVNMPINLRRFFPTQTLRNFSSYFNFSFNREDVKLTIEEIAQKIKEQASIINKDYLMGNINVNVLAQKNFFVRILPRALKNLALKLSYKMFGESIQTTVFTNMGKLKTPKEFSDYIVNYEAILGESKLNKIGVCAVGFDNKLTITFSSKIKESEIQRLFFSYLTSMGLKVDIISNY